MHYDEGLEKKVSCTPGSVLTFSDVKENKNNWRGPFVSEFEKVSLYEYVSSIIGTDDIDKEMYDRKYKKNREQYENIKLPKRATSGSAGYDFFFPCRDIVLEPGESIKIHTGIKCKIIPGWCLILIPRSSYGYKYRCQLDNTVGLIDSDYYNCEQNEGHISVKITNDSKEGKKLCLKNGEAFCQGIFLQYGLTVNDNTYEERKGGVGSTTKDNEKI